MDDKKPSEAFMESRSRQDGGKNHDGRDMSDMERFKPDLSGRDIEETGKKPMAANSSINDYYLESAAATLDPCSSSYDIMGYSKRRGAATITNTSVEWVVYLAVRETPTFAAALQRCQALLPHEVNTRCLQQDGTRHVTLWIGSMTQDQARRICFNRSSSSRLHQFPISIRFQGWVPHGGYYLELDDSSQDTLQELMEGSLRNLPSKGIRWCDGVIISPCTVLGV